MIGYYLYNEKVFRKRYDLFDEIRKNNDIDPKASLWFYDDVFTKHSWVKEPEEDIDTLYKQQAQYLRDSYDYLILCFSGGADSYNVLYSFISNGIHLDEVYTAYPLKMMAPIENGTYYPDNKDLTILAEYKESALPRLTRLAKTNPEIKIRIGDFSNFIVDNYKSSNFIEDNKEALSVNQAHYGGLREVYTVTEQMKYVADNIKGRVAVIFGYEKPSFTRANGHLITYFSDLGRNPPLFAAYDLPYEPVMFYHHPQAARMLIKQGHIFKKKLISEPKLRKVFDGQFYANHIKESIWMEKLLYPSSFNHVYQQPVKFGDDDVLSYHLGSTSTSVIDEIWSDIKKIPVNIDNLKVRQINNSRIMIKSKFYDLGRFIPFELSA